MDSNWQGDRYFRGNPFWQKGASPDPFPKIYVRARACGPGRIWAVVLYNDPERGGVKFETGIPTNSE